MKTDSQIPEDVSLLISDCLKGVISNEGLSRLKMWLYEDEEHFKQFNTLKSAWILSGNSVSYLPDKVEKELEKLKSKLRNNKSIKTVFWTFSKVAASWIIVLSVGTLLGMFFNKSNINEISTITTITAPLGSRSIVDLPDGSKVWINAGSKITYNSTFGKINREVNLTGEAYFSVRTNKKIPFFVKTSDIIVKAVGTKFNVKAYPNEKVITTTLEEGKIIVTSLHDKSRIKNAELKPKQMLTYITKTNDKESLPANDPQKEPMEGEKLSVQANIYSEVKTELTTSWKDNTWIIEGQPLGSLVPMLERRYNIVIRFGAEEIKQYKFTGKIQNETVEQIMTAIELSAPIKYQINNNSIDITLNRTLLEKYKKNTN